MLKLLLPICLLDSFFRVQITFNSLALSRLKGIILDRRADLREEAYVHDMLKGKCENVLYDNENFQAEALCFVWGIRNELLPVPRKQIHLRLFLQTR